MSILQLDDVSYQYVTPYVTVQAVRNVTYGFEKGKVYSLTGTSGSGKTTLLSIMAGLDLPSSGQVLFKGKPTSQLDLDRYRRENTTVIYQNFYLLPLLTVAENVMYPMELIGEKPAKARKKALELIKQVGLTEDEFGRFPTQLSGGQQQRVAIARALGTPAEVILADEPTGNLDKENTETVLNLLVDLAHTHNYCVIIITHDNELAAKTDVTLQMDDGKLLV